MGVPKRELTAVRRAVERGEQRIRRLRRKADEWCPEVTIHPGTSPMRSSLHSLENRGRGARSLERFQLIEIGAKGEAASLSASCLM